MITERSEQGTVRRASSGDLAELARLFKEEAEHEAELSQGVFAFDAEFDWLAFAEQALNRSKSAVFVYVTPQRVSGLIYTRAVNEASVRSDSPLKRVAAKVLGRSRPVRPASATNSVYGMIEHVYVEPASRRSNAALGLFNAVNRWATESGIDELRGLVWAENVPTDRFVQALGFRPLRIMYRKELKRGK